MTVPILLVTGFLGAGKTTFINGLLQDARGLSIAAIVNDFGSVNIDAALLETATDEVIGLKNGCICCSLQGDLLRTLRQVLAGGTRDLVVIEASGVADPQGIVQALMDPVLWPAAALDSIVCLIDAGDLAATPERAADPLWAAQVAAADFVHLSKTGEARPGDVGALTARLAAMGKTAVFGQDGSARDIRDLIARGTPRPGAGRTRRATLDSARFATLDSARFATLEWRCESAVSLPAFQRLIGQLAPRLLRAKGFLTFAEKPGDAHLFQMVGKRATLARHERPQKGCDLVLIGEAATLEPDATRRALDALPRA
ncbi:CobW family GTP-binding protein [Acidimangrovimonas sediminis]|uniref:CobW family GTP-binding protein n=1 Tax=Acidimangrovimonas sediminis TaxID=2056283 RepID=UPI000C80A79E|nr:CobW family GTP-binding protein [Acidimangrovimonas sediminis]